MDEVSLGEYRVLERIGKGGMGTVYRAEHVPSGKPAAVKVLRPEASANSTLLQRFFNEARAASAIEHPGIVEIYDFGHHDGRAFIAMELLVGESLSERLREVERICHPDAVRLTRQVADALGAAHARGIIHRDLKPDNIFLVGESEDTDGDEVKVLDFGIAKLTGGMSLALTQEGMLVGTPRYMAPEQFKAAREVDHRADLYALGCILFEMLCGRPPFTERNVNQLVIAHATHPPPMPRQLEPSVPGGLETVLLQLLAKSPATRFKDTDELIAALR